MDDRTSLNTNSDEGQNEDLRLSRRAFSSPSNLINAQGGRRYWENVNADINGMLGGVPAVVGFSSVSRIDLQGSRTFLARLGIGIKSGRKPVISALDGGAGCVSLTSRSRSHELYNMRRSH